ncbi:hypothetical protein ACIQUF_03070 [Pseudomonas sp. NPDC090233]|uniref:hypothetical protein n=1 Tax=Pseudomonas sp. NPDC090233 TaxID=3364479 RepID=UPI00383B4F39
MNKRFWKIWESWNFWKPAAHENLDTFNDLLNGPVTGKVLNRTGYDITFLGDEAYTVEFNAGVQKKKDCCGY